MSRAPRQRRALDWPIAPAYRLLVSRGDTLPHRMAPYFARHQRTIKLGPSTGADGLREAQLGAAWALGSHWTASASPAQIVLPTGVGKTLVMTLAPFLKPARRVLVVAPGRVLRDQLAAAFSSLADLKRADVLPAAHPGPKVITVRHNAGPGDWARWRQADVVVGNVQNLSSHYQGVEPLQNSLFDLVLVDEGHHVPAEAWRTLLRAVDAPSAFFTATPFRRDRRRLPGDLLYAYPLSRAIAARVYSPVAYRAVHPSQEVPDRDEALAQAAVERLHSDEHVAAGSKLLVRADRVRLAEDLVDVYRRAGANLGLVVGRLSWRQVETTISQARTGTLDGLVCVAGLIEGFDLPTLRLAAYHRPHRTLAPTLQFVGRLARPGLEVHGELLAVPLDIAEELEALYREDASWQDLLPTIYDESVEEERALRKYVDQAHTSGPIEVSPLAIRPGRSARILRVAADELDLDVDPPRLGGTEVVWRFYSEETDLLALVTLRRHAPRWLHADTLDTWQYELHLACSVREHTLVFLASEDSRTLRDLRHAIGASRAVNLDGEDLGRLLWAVAPDNYFSVGLRPTRDDGSSYRMVAGRRVETALRPAEQRAASLGHAIGGGGNRTFGMSVAKSKLWEPESTDSLLEFRRWCEERARDLATAAPARGAPRLAVSLGQRFDEFPAAPVLAIALEHTMLAGGVRLMYDGSRVPVHALELQALRVTDTELSIEVLQDGESIWLGAQAPNGSITEISGALEAADQATGELGSFSALLEERPPIVLFADGSSTQGALIEHAREATLTVPDDYVIAGVWDGVDTQCEVGASRDGLQSIHDALAEQLTADCEFVLTDHGTGELADLIGLEPDSVSGVRVTLVHCKAARAPRPRRQLVDIQEVLTQAARSARWADPAAGLWQELRERLDRRPTYCRVVRGDSERARTVLEELQQTVAAPRVSILAVQPGLDLDRLADWTAGETLLSLATEWCSDAGAELRLLGSNSG